MASKIQAVIFDVAIIATVIAFYNVGYDTIQNRIMRLDERTSITEDDLSAFPDLDNMRQFLERLLTFIPYMIILPTMAHMLWVLFRRTSDEKRIVRR